MVTIKAACPFSNADGTADPLVVKIINPTLEFAEANARDGILGLKSVSQCEETMQVLGADFDVVSFVNEQL